MLKRHLVRAIVAAAAMIVASVTPGVAQERNQTNGGENGAPYEEGEIVRDVSNFFQMTTKDTAKAVQGIFARFGKPNAYIAGEEGSGAIIFGLRYGKGLLYRKGQAPVTVYWQGPSLGFDVGGNGSKCFTLVYNLPGTDAIYQRFPGIEGIFYFVAGIGVNYQQNGDIILAPMRTGLGLRAGANVGYLSYSRERDWLPL